MRDRKLTTVTVLAGMVTVLTATVTVTGAQPDPESAEVPDGAG
jgi:hypothetical protein